MKSSEVFIAHPTTNEQVSALKAFMEALQIKFEVASEDTYAPSFVEKVLEAKRQIGHGKFTEVKQENLKSFVDGL